MPELRNATVTIGVPGLNGTGVSGAEKTDIFDRLTALEALTVPDEITDLTDVDLTGAAEGDHLVIDASGDVVVETPAAIPADSSLGYSIDGGGDPITTGNKRGFKVDYAFTIVEATLAPDVSTTTTVDIWCDTTYPPTDADSITAAAPLTITASASATVDTTLTGWDTTHPAGTWVFFNVDANNNAEWLGIDLKIERTVGP